MSVVTGQILDLKTSNELFFQPQGTNEKYYLGNLLNIGELNVGKTFTFDLVPEYRAVSIFKNAEGEYKLIGILTNNNGILYPIFRSNSGEILATSEKVESFNNYILGDFFDLSLVEIFKGFNVFNNLPANKTSSNVEVLVLNKLQNGYLVLYNGKTVFLSTCTNLDSFIGLPILLDIYRKFWVSEGNIGTSLALVKKTDAIFNLTDKNLGLSIVLIDKKPYVFKSGNILNTNNSGLTLTIDYLPTQFSEFKSFFPAPANTGYELVNILKSSSGNPLYTFVNANDSTDVRAIKFLDPIDLNNRLGSFFTFESSEFYLLVELSPSTDTTTFQLKQIFKSSSDVFVFSKEGKTYYVNGENFDIAPSLVGKYFIIEYIPYIVGKINDVN